MHRLLVLVLLISCSKQAEEEPCDTAVYVCDTAAWWDRKKAENATMDSTEGVWLDKVRVPGCAGSNVWIFSARTHGWTNGTSRVNAWASEAVGGFNEEHPVDVVESNPDGSWDELEVELQHSATQQQYQPGARTSYICGVHDQQPEMTYVFRVYDVDGNYADCGILTTRTDADTAVAEVLQGQVDEPTEVSDRTQITTENCSVWTVPGNPNDTTPTGS